MSASLILNCFLKLELPLLDIMLWTACEVLGLTVNDVGKLEVDQEI